MFQLTAKTGSFKGASWPISETPLVLGRDVLCDITIDDPIVSRRHCEVTFSDGAVTVVDLGSSNATFVNARPVKQAKLSVGDEVAVGGVIFFVTMTRGNVPDSVPRRNAGGETHSLIIGEPTYLDEDASSLFAQGRPRTAEELAGLFHIGRELSQTNGIGELMAKLLEQAGRRFSPEGLWAALCQEQDQDLLVYPQDDAAAVVSDKAVRDIVWKAIRKPRGILLPERWEKDGQAGVRTTMVAPIALGKEPVGALIAQADTPKRIYDESDLEFLLAIAHAAAPYIKAAERLERLERENRRLLSGGSAGSPLIGSSQAMQRVRALARDAARSGLNVLILGETGTGKELVARLIHDLSGAAEKNLTVVNCAAIPDELFESEVFGHERGAFTGAHAAKSGLFEEANGGTLFLDEVGDTSLHNQARLLRAIETGTFRRVGGTRDIHVKVRVLAATNRDLEKEVATGKFRRDLLHRLNAFELRLPSLRDRRADIPGLAEHFLHQARERQQCPAEGFTAEALQALSQRPWPGNVRELRNVIERAAALARAAKITLQDLCIEPAKAPAPSADPQHASAPFPTLTELERNHMARAITMCNGNIGAAAELLGIGRSTLYRKAAEYGLQ